MSQYQINLQHSHQGSVDLNTQLLTGQADYYPENEPPRSFLSFEKTELIHYITSVRWFSLKWFTVMRFILCFLFIAATPCLIIVHLHLPKETDKYTVTTPWFFLTPHWILHCFWLLFYLIVTTMAFKHRTLIKQLHEYTQRLDPIQTPFSLRVAHYLYTVMITITPVYYATELIWAPADSVVHAPWPGIYGIFVSAAMLLELVTNRIPLLWSHLVFPYLTAVPYYVTMFVLWNKGKVKVQSHWWALWDSRGDTDVLVVPMFCFFFAAMNVAVVTFMIWKLLELCKPERERERHTGAVYFFNTSEYGTDLKLSSANVYHGNLDTPLSPTA